MFLLIRPLHVGKENDEYGLRKYGHRIFQGTQKERQIEIEFKNGMKLTVYQK